MVSTRQLKKVFGLILSLVIINLALKAFSQEKISKPRFRKIASTSFEDWIPFEHVQGWMSGDWFTTGKIISSPDGQICQLRWDETLAFSKRNFSTRKITIKWKQKGWDSIVEIHSRGPRSIQGYVDAKKIRCKRTRWDCFKEIFEFNEVREITYISIRHTYDPRDYRFQHFRANKTPVFIDDIEILAE